ncbi:hypothetical protein, unknown function [Leishmania infantum JPCM5]|uniref:Uncharacterized protein n=2 Tax=Leishmania infantum TaxID=5671 RepID=A4IA14_LEIIN|nr:hypothetical protein, unknown function [Leishmania infantum JPCM5]CAC9538986.1 hypothetical_protein_-_conserved [Leishmania infantum]CAM71670.1 hypothetical protein, unknown function [Leishmania infantum JPCM5]SUZ45596.1 hypothetical_protein_-_conserved [Leishmania infantum]|eukprot:XP_001468583.1 hypothetical protein, unknown function [Leishmania infantum JPCM5]
MSHIHHTYHGRAGSSITTLSCSSLAAQGSEKQRQYGQRCALLREERYRRGSICALENNEWAELSIVCADELAVEWWREDARKSNNAGPTEPRPTRYTYRYRAGTTVSVLPVVQSTEALNGSLTAAVGTVNAEENQLRLWEWENRADLQEWELGERQEMAQAMQSILVAQRELQLAHLEAACRRVMNGTTALDWTSYPRYDRPELLS